MTQKNESLDADDKEISSLYSESVKDSTPKFLDDAILAKAHRAVAAQPQSVALMRMRRWQKPVSLAAVIVLSVTIVYLMPRQDEYQRASEPQLTMNKPSDVFESEQTSTVSRVASRKSNQEVQPHESFAELDDKEQEVAVIGNSQTVPPPVQAFTDEPAVVRTPTVKPVKQTSDEELLREIVLRDARSVSESSQLAHDEYTDTEIPLVSKSKSYKKSSSIVTKSSEEDADLQSKADLLSGSENESVDEVVVMGRVNSKRERKDAGVMSSDDDRLVAHESSGVMVANDKEHRQSAIAWIEYLEVLKKNEEHDVFDKEIVEFIKKYPDHEYTQQYLNRKKVNPNN